MASALSANTRTGLACISSAAMAAGTNSRRIARIFIVVALWPSGGDRSSSDGSDGRRLVEQHDRYVVPHRITEPAVVADERGFRFAILERPLALRAHEDGEQLWGE